MRGLAAQGRSALRILAAVAVAAWAAPAAALDPQRATSQYVVSRWGVDGDLPSNSVNALLQTRDGYLWLGTGAGLVRFDAARFVVFDAPGTPQFGAGGVTRLAEGGDGALYFGTKAGTVIRYAEGTFMLLPIRAGTGPIESLFAARDGSLWVASLGRPVTRWLKGRAVSLYSKLDALGPHALAVDARGSLWVGTRRDGLVRFDGGVRARYRAAEGLASDTVQALLFDRAGTLWVGTPEGLCRGDGDRFRCLTPRDGLSHKSVTALLEDRDGALWVGTAGGLNRLYSGRFSRFTREEGLSDDEVRCLLEDHEGNLWVGTADGLTRLSEGRFVTYGRLEGLRDPATRSVVGGARGTVWIGTTSGLVARLEEGAVREQIQVGAQPIISMHESSDGSLWVGEDGGRLFQIREGRVNDRTPTGLPQGRKIPAIAEGEGGPVFFVSGIGLVRLEGGRFVALRPETSALGYVHRIHRDRRGVLWLCGSRGLGRLEGDAYRVLTRQEGLPHERVRWLSEEDDGRLWAVTIGGLALVEGGRVRAVTVEHGLPEAYLRVALDDGRGHLWMASLGHVFRLSKREILELFAGRRTRVSPLSFDASDGLRSTEMLLSSNPGFRAADGRLWFATAKGASVVDPNRVTAPAPAPRVVLQELTVDGRRERLAEYPPGRGEVRIEYAALAFRAASKVRFRHRLEGLDPDWVDVGTRRSAYYTRLPPGHYRFSVMASDVGGFWSGDPVSVSFAIRPSFFRTPGFYGACVLGLAGLVAAAHRWRLRQVRARFAAIIGERTRIARELHDTLAQGLAGVGIQIDTALRAFSDRPDLSRRHMQLARAMVRSSLAEVRRSIWVLRAQATKGVDGLASTLSSSLAQLTADTGIAPTLQVTGRPQPLPAEVERNLLRIAHEAVTNAVRHAGAHSLVVELHFDGGGVDFRVRDDGCGFDTEVLAHARGAHFGLAGISERAQALGGEVRVESRPGAGTEVACRLPYQSRVDPQEGRGGEGASP